MSQSTSYQTIEEHASQIHNLEQTDHLLRWDSDVMMPAGGADARSGQRETLSKIMHDLRGSDALRSALEAVNESRLSTDERAVVREIRREYEITVAVSEELQSELADVTACAYEAWKEAKENDDWSTFAPLFEEHIDLRRKWADAVDPDSDPYEVLWKSKLGYTSQPFIELSTVNRVFDRLKSTLPGIISDVREISELMVEYLDSNIHLAGPVPRQLLGTATTSGIHNFPSWGRLGSGTSCTAGMR